MAAVPRQGGGGYVEARGQAPGRAPGLGVVPLQHAPQRSRLGRLGQQNQILEGKHLPRKFKAELNIQKIW